MITDSPSLNIHTYHVSIAAPPALFREHRYAQLLVSIYLTHLLDVQWQDYDNSLLSELQLPEFLLHSAISKHIHTLTLHYAGLMCSV